MLSIIMFIIAVTAIVWYIKNKKTDDNSTGNGPGGSTTPKEQQK